jgi:hypothetical protein
MANETSSLSFYKIKRCKLSTKILSAYEIRNTFAKIKQTYKMEN